MAKKKKEQKPKNIEIINRKAAHQFNFQGEVEAGIMLTGTEIKSIRAGTANLKDAFCFFRKGELYVKNMFIGEYKFGSIYNHEPRRLRKLLLKKQELKKLHRKVQEKGMTLVPYRLYISERGFAKLEVALASGKRSYDKRHAIKERENSRNMDRLKKIRL